MIRMPRYERRNEKNNRTRPSSIYFLFFFFVYSVQLHGGESVELIFHSASFSPSSFLLTIILFSRLVSYFNKSDIFIDRYIGANVKIGTNRERTMKVSGGGK